MPYQKLTNAEATLLDCRFQVKFIFGEQRAFVLDRRMQNGKFLPLSEPASEENYLLHFELICKALRRLGECRADEQVLCTSKRHNVWRLPNGRVVVTSQSPSDFRAF